jgi:hypothetical protein
MKINVGMSLSSSKNVCPNNTVRSHEMKYSIAMAIALAIVACGCACQRPHAPIVLSKSDIAQVESKIPTLTPGMTEAEALQTLGLFPISKYSRPATAGGQNTRYHFDYKLGDSGILSVIYNRNNLSAIEFGNRATGTKTTSKELSEPTH